jgi:outer membrane protein insertion porin family
MTREDTARECSSTSATEPACGGLTGAAGGRSTPRGTPLRAVALLAAVTLCLAGLAAPLQARPRSWYVGKVSFGGNQSFSDRALLSRMDSKPPLLFKRTPFSQFQLDDDILALNQFYQEQGFLAARVSVADVKRNDRRHRVDIAIDVAEGPPTLVDSICFEGLTAVPASGFCGELLTRPGERMVTTSLEQDALLIQDSLRGRGRYYADVDYYTTVDSATWRSSVLFAVRQGPVVRVRTVTVSGDSAVRPVVMTRELSFRKGEVLTSPAVRSSVQRIYATGLFTYVQINPVPPDMDDPATPPDTVFRPVNIDVRNAQFFKIRATAGYGSIERFNGSLATSYSNLFRVGHQVGFNGVLSSIQMRGDLIYAMPWLGPLPLQTRVQAYGERDTYPYRGAFYGAYATFEGLLGRHFSYRVKPRFEQVIYTDFLNPPDSLTNIPSQDTRSIQVGGAFDTRNNIFNPLNGLFADLSGELAGLGGRNVNHYYRLLSDTRGYVPFPAPILFSAALQLGYVAGYGASGSFVPPQERLYLGFQGLRIVRGYPRGSLGDSLGSNVALVANIFDIRFPIVWWFQGAVFSDVGYTWPSLSAVRLSDLRWTIGPGLIVATPVLVVRVDYGFRLNPHGSGVGGIFFSIGQPF